MHARDEAVPHHSPAAWALLAVGAAFALELAGVLAWNLVDRHPINLTALREKAKF